MWGEKTYEKIPIMMSPSLIRGLRYLEWTWSVGVLEGGGRLLWAVFFRGEGGEKI